MEQKGIYVRTDKKVDDPCTVHTEIGDNSFDVGFNGGDIETKQVGTFLGIGGLAVACFLLFVCIWVVLCCVLIPAVIVIVILADYVWQT